MWWQCTTTHCLVADTVRALSNVICVLAALIIFIIVRDKEINLMLLAFFSLVYSSANSVCKKIEHYRLEIPYFKRQYVLKIYLALEAISILIEQLIISLFVIYLLFQSIFLNSIGCMVIDLHYFSSKFHQLYYLTHKFFLTRDIFKMVCPRLSKPTLCLGNKIKFRLFVNHYI